MSNATQASRWRWRTLDIVTAAVLGAACGVIFFAYNTPGYAWYEAANAVTPGLAGIANGIWLLGGPLGGLIIRKPGAAILVEIVASLVSAGLGNAWGLSTLMYGLFQGLGAELVFLMFAYRKFSLWVGLLAGAMAGVGAWAISFILGDLEKSLAYNVIYLSTSAISGAILAGAVAWYLTYALARAGALNRFAAGRAARDAA